MIAVKEAVTKAKQFFRDLYSDDVPHGVRLEEVQLSDDGKFWLVTIGYNADYTTLNRDYGRVFDPGFRNKSEDLVPIPREYKVVRLNADTGNLDAIAIRKP